MNNFGICPRLLVGSLTIFAALLLPGCATTDISIASGVDSNNNPTANGSVSMTQALGFIDSKIALVEAKKKDFGTLGRTAKIGTFVGTLGLGASGIAGLHRDAAIGFAALAGTSYQLGTMSATELSRQFCRDAIAALMCVRGLAEPMQGGFALIDVVLGKSGGQGPAADSMKQAGDLLPRLQRSPDLASKLIFSAGKLELSVLKAQPLVILESKAAQALHANAVSVLLKLEESLDHLQPGVGAYQVSATAIVSQLRAYMPAPTAPGGKAASTVLPEKLMSILSGESSQESSERQLAEQLAERLIAKIDLQVETLNKAFAMLTDAVTVDAQQAASCQGKLVGAIPTLVTNPPGPVVLGKDSGEIVINVSGGSGLYFPTWLGAVPPTDLLSMTQVARPNGSVLSFRQLKEAPGEISYKLQVVDSASQPQTVTIEVRLAAKPPK